MISKGDLVKMRLSLGSDSQSGVVRELFILGRMMNYCDEEETYIIEPRAISIRKDQVAEATRLLEDFDFENASQEMSIAEDKRERVIPPDIVDIRVSNNH